MIALLKRHSRRFKDAFIINLDHVGGETPRVVTREGVIFGFRGSRKLSHIALSAVKGSRNLDIKRGKCRLKKSDAMVANARGFSAITIGGVRKGIFTGWRNAADTSGSISRANLDKAVQVTQLMLEKIDELPDSQFKPHREARIKWRGDQSSEVSSDTGDDEDYPVEE